MRNNAFILPPSTQMATTERQPNLGLTVFHASNMFCAIRMKIFQTKASMTHKGTYDWFRLFYFALQNPIQKRQPTNLITKLKKRLPKKNKFKIRQTTTQNGKLYELNSYNNYSTFYMVVTHASSSGQ